MSSETSRSHTGRRATSALRLGLIVVVAVGGLWFSTRGIAGVGWRDVWDAVRGVSLGELATLAAIWAAGLVIYSSVLAAAMPGLGMKRGLLLNLSGSAVANVLPLGGAVATALNWRMMRAWGHSTPAFVAFSVLTNALDVIAKLLLPLVAVASLAAVSRHVPTLLWVAAAVGVLVLLAAAGLRELVRRRRGRPTSPPMARWWTRLETAVRDSNDRIDQLLRRGWRRLLPGSIAYVAAQVALLGYALHVVGLDMPLATLLAAAAIERLGTVLPVTPGGVGVAEIGTIAWLVATGLSPAAVVAGVLIYRVFLVVLEIPVGGVLLAGWVWTDRHSRRRRLEGALT